MNAVQYFDWGISRRSDFIKMVFNIEQAIQDVSFAWMTKTSKNKRRINNESSSSNDGKINEYSNFNIGRGGTLFIGQNYFEFESKGLYYIEIQGISNYIDLSHANEITRFTTLKLTCEKVYVNQEQMNKLNTGQLPNWKLPVNARYIVK